jgi:hypothetical protein
LSQKIHFLLTMIGIKYQNLLKLNEDGNLYKKYKLHYNIVKIYHILIISLIIYIIYTKLIHIIYR